MLPLIFFFLDVGPEWKLMEERSLIISYGAEYRFTQNEGSCAIQSRCSVFWNFAIGSKLFLSHVQKRLFLQLSL